MSSPHLISWMVFIPVIGAVLQSLIAAKSTARWVALGASLLSSICGIALVSMMQAGVVEAQAMESLPWVGSYAINYEMSIDGLNVLPVLLLAIVFPLLITSEWNQKTGVKGMHGLFLILQASLVGAVCAQDLFLLFFFWSLSAIPFYFLIGIWGGKDREPAAFRVMVTSAIGNCLFFAALVLLYYSVEPHTFLLREAVEGRATLKTLGIFGLSVPINVVLFCLISAGLALRAPIWPIHGWFTKAAEEAPSSVFVALAGATVPVALYIFIRISYSLFPEVVMWSSSGIVVAGVLNLLIGCMCALAQKGLRLLLAFICLSEVGLLLMGIGSLNAAGIVGSVYQQLVLGLGLTGFGLFSGLIIERTGTATFLGENDEVQLGGLATKAPAMAFVVGVIICSILGVPGLGGFVGHALLMIGGYSIHPLVLVLGGGALLVATYYLFTMYRYVFLGSVSSSAGAFEDLSFRERAFLLPLVAALLVFGVYPKPFLDLVRPTVLTLLSTVK